MTEIGNLSFLGPCFQRLARCVAACLLVFGTGCVKIQNVELASAPAQSQDTATFAYVASAGQAPSLAGFRIPSPGTLEPASWPSVPLPAAPGALVVGDRQAFVLAGSGTELLVLQRDPLSGEVLRGAVTAFSLPEPIGAITLSATQEFLYAAAAGDGKIHGYRIQRGSGTLEAIPTSPFDPASASAVQGCQVLKSHPTGYFLFAACSPVTSSVGSASVLRVYSIDETSGSLRRVPSGLGSWGVFSPITALDFDYYGYGLFAVSSYHDRVFKLGIFPESGSLVLQEISVFAPSAEELSLAGYVATAPSGRNDESSYLPIGSAQSSQDLPLPLGIPSQGAILPYLGQTPAIGTGAEPPVYLASLQPPVSAGEPSRLSLFRLLDAAQTQPEALPGEKLPDSSVALKVRASPRGAWALVLYQSPPAIALHANQDGRLAEKGRRALAPDPVDLAIY